MFDKVNLYYRKNIDELAFGKRFHFASRRWLWNDDDEMSKKLAELKQEFCANGNDADLEKIVRELMNTPIQDFGAKNAAAERAPYFDKYPDLRPSLLVFFRLIFTETIYGIDARKHYAANFDITKIDKMQSALLEDDPAISTLSTHAINFFYLYNRFFKQSEDGVPLQHLSQIAESIDTSNNTNLLLKIYLLTHCIIGETLFYKRHIPQSAKPIYMTMLKSLEETVSERYDDINMDNKFEILVCARILGVRSGLSDRIYAEAEGSISDQGDFIIDKLNNNPQSANIDFETSEHRNVLYLLSHSEFEPSDRIIS